MDDPEAENKPSQLRAPVLPEFVVQLKRMSPGERAKYLSEYLAQYGEVVEASEPVDGWHGYAPFKDPGAN